MELFQIIYLVFALIAIFTTCVLLKDAKEQTRKNILKYSSILTLIIHVSAIWTVFFSTNFAAQYGALTSTIWPVFPCNLAMILLPITFSMKKQIKLFYPFVISLAIFGGLTTLIFPNFHIDGPITWLTLRSYISHTLLAFVGLYAIVSGEYKPKIKDIINVAVGIVLGILFGYFTIFLFQTFKQQPVNAMFINQPAIPGTFLNAYWLAIILLAMYSTYNLIYNYIVKKKKTKNIIKEKK